MERLSKEGEMKELYSDKLYYNLALEKENVNINQAYLCYQHAAFYAKESDKVIYHKRMKEICEMEGFAVEDMSVILLSYQDVETTKNCIQSIKENEDMSCVELVVIDNASTDGSAEWVQVQSDMKSILNDKNLGFPAACNQGIEVAEKKNDVLLLNNDTLIPPNAFFWLRMGLYESKDTGATGSISNNVANYQNIKEMNVTDKEYLEYGEKYNTPMEYPYELKSWLVGFCVLLKRTILEQTGYLDERFTPGNFEDNDLGTRINLMGLKQRLCLNSFVFHYGSKSFSKKSEKFLTLYENNTAKYEQKWNMHPYNHTYIRIEELSFMPQSNMDKMRILEVGCGCGATLGRLRRIYPNAEIVGIEKEVLQSKIASQIEPTICGDILDLELKNIGTFDYILLGGIFEHISEPQKLLGIVKTLLVPQGIIISSSYNFMNPQILKKIADGNMEYTNEGILDRKHIRFYTIQTILDEFSKAQISVTDITFQTIKLSLEEEEFLNYILQMNYAVDKNQYLAYQYITKACVL